MISSHTNKRSRGNRAGGCTLVKVLLVMIMLVFSLEYEQFMRDLEEDKELRSQINLFKGVLYVHRHMHRQQCARTHYSYNRLAIMRIPFTPTVKHSEEILQERKQAEENDMVDDDARDFPEVGIEELMDDLSLSEGVDI